MCQQRCGGSQQKSTKQVEMFWKSGTDRCGQRERILQKTWAMSQFKRQIKYGK